MKNCWGTCWSYFPDEPKSLPPDGAESSLFRARLFGRLLFNVFSFDEALVYVLGVFPLTYFEGKPGCIDFLVESPLSV